MKVNTLNFQFSIVKNVSNPRHLIRIWFRAHNLLDLVFKKEGGGKWVYLFKYLNRKSQNFLKIFHSDPLYGEQDFYVKSVSQRTDLIDGPEDISNMSNILFIKSQKGKRQEFSTKCPVKAL